ncbi:MAG: hypothetical protein HC899_39555 [Leptolyngbyaceae cyanobacterium SM1_4_3]|nr:hypothetical protein [Leptolyngbyaceae cyanobacterium SM1_4_3]
MEAHPKIPIVPTEGGKKSIGTFESGLCSPGFLQG